MPCPDIYWLSWPGGRDSALKCSLYDFAIRSKPPSSAADHTSRLGRDSSNFTSAPPSGRVPFSNASGGEVPGARDNCSGDGGLATVYESLEGRGFSESCRHRAELRGHLIHQIRMSSPKFCAVLLLAKAWPV